MSNHYLIMQIEEQEIALEVSEVARVIRAVELVEVPDTPTSLQGVFNLAGEMTCVISTRALLNHPAKEIDPEDILVILETQNTFALLVDAVAGVFELTPIHKSQTMLARLTHTHVAQWQDHLIPILSSQQLQNTLEQHWHLADTLNTEVAHHDE